MARSVTDFRHVGEDADSLYRAAYWAIHSDEDADNVSEECGWVARKLSQLIVDLEALRTLIEEHKQVADSSIEERDTNAFLAELNSRAQGG